MSGEDSGANEIAELTNDINSALNGAIIQGFLGDKPGDETVVICEILETNGHEVLVTGQRGHPIEIRVNKK